MIFDKATGYLNKRSQKRLTRLPAPAAFYGCLTHHFALFLFCSRIFWFEGNYEAYEADRRERLGEDAAVPRSVKYRKLIRD